MKAQGSICRIGVFYDGSYFAYAQSYFYHDRNLGWLSFQPLHTFFETFIAKKEQGFSSYKVVYAAWHQGMFPGKDATDEQLRFDRRLYHDLMHAGVDPKYLPVSQQRREKGTDVALAVDALQVGLDGKIDIAVLVTGDGDFVPLVRALNKHGIRVLAAYFDFQDSRGKKSFINERLLKCCNYEVDVGKLDGDRESGVAFKGLFRTASDLRDRAEAQTRLADDQDSDSSA
ncbi:MAG: NYN domain-containing protein [Phycisphaerales bacterium]|nr:MAG: NYN domain-containing protein [Phycisphaerales bacterium]